MGPLHTHLTLLEESSARYASRPIFMVPRQPVHAEGIGKRDWYTITFPQFLQDVELAARYWLRTLNESATPLRSVVGLWVGGTEYTDVLHIFGVARAGFVPQALSLLLPNPGAAYELLSQTNAHALIIDPSFASMSTNCPIPVHIAVRDIHAMVMDVDDIALPPVHKASAAEDIAMIFHTSGSSSRRPKLVPCSYRWLDALIAKTKQGGITYDPRKQDVTAWMGSMCHIGQTFMVLGAMQHGACLVQPTTIAFSSDELVDMITRCGLNRLMQFSTFLGIHLRRARQDVAFLARLQSLDEVLYSGLPLSQEDKEWALSNGIVLRNLYGTTECGGSMLLSIGGRDSNAHLLRPLEGVSYRFCPVSDIRASNALDASPLLELVVLSDSGDCPHYSLRDVDGHFHTRDLFQEVSPGCYVFRGREDDWIKSENGLRCDTKAIEDEVRSTCKELVFDCVVVGTGRPSPALFVEGRGTVDAEALKEEILRRTQHSQAERYLHEQIVSTKFVFVVPPNSLPRTSTKGNIRRQAVEIAFKAELDEIYRPIF
ncbi:acetyl-CoA synthetase-like protein [Sparassis crispa]|uniref:Acetyl-CoA synthetase-like protein n=1 Tax=Sparassis crispa TaxID=139825 RepID=A0A401GHJ3_9APHY|nr:acetyl-CoA synthetase-like protein [Sparassis crispa]GBE81642.1 acetyl-CoA synthetase-like protein [Sparassis crispa]